MLDNGPSGPDPTETPAPGDAAPAGGASFAMPAWVDDLRRLGRGLKHLFSAQLALAAAEIGLARSGIVMMLFMGLAAITFAVALGFTLLALAGWGLAQWFGSWAWALAALAGIQMILLVLSILVFRRGMHWLTLPATRAELATLAKQAAAQGKAESELREKG
ncbi:ABC transporter ATP-binding protein [Luteibacter pinisoli]|uniref:ABC transporter ATP-binding protein n=1 Tax=Luteibacter pinisoli TaxID=2589080 RepID=A0A4Y5Z048_9GAMM|nr:ABC transporter ATP-binding protein [Luteibacter pinisoli]QDE37823.1 ABC transporter ATP-binding protein [Luteibacter pinisoli]